MKSKIYFTTLIFHLILCSVDSSYGYQWEKTLGGNTSDFYYGSSVQQTVDGGYIIAGSVGGGIWDFYLIKTDSNGNKQWEKTLGDANNYDYDWARSVQQTADGGYIIAGYTSFPSNYRDVYLIKTDANGDKQWEKTFGGTLTDEGYQVQQTKDGGYIIVGYTDSINLNTEVYLIKTDANGNKQWEKTFDGDYAAWGYSVQQTADDGYIIAGSTGSVYLIKTDVNGAKQWEKTFGLGIGRSVQQAADGGYIIAGFNAIEDHIFLIKTNANGAKQWEKTFGFALPGWEDDEVSVQQTADGGYVIVGTTIFSFEAGGGDVYLIKTDANGNKQWEKTFGGANSREGGSQVQQTKDGGFIIIGTTESSGTFWNAYLIYYNPAILNDPKPKVMPWLMLLLD